jgi:signal peptidase I
LTLAASLRQGFALSFDILFWCLVAIAVATVVLGFLPGLTHRQLLAVSGGSMEPALSAGDAVLVRPLADPARQVRVGDVVVLQPSAQAASRAHRIVLVSTDGAGQTAFLTSGDANAEPDPVWVNPAEIRASVIATLPGLGYALRFLSQPLARLVLFVLPVIFLAGRELLGGLGLGDDQELVEAETL